MDEAAAAPNSDEGAGVLCPNTELELDDDAGRDAPNIDVLAAVVVVVLVSPNPVTPLVALAPKLLVAKPAAGAVDVCPNAGAAAVVLVAVPPPNTDAVAAVVEVAAVVMVGWPNSDVPPAACPNAPAVALLCCWPKIGAVD